MLVICFLSWRCIFFFCTKRKKKSLIYKKNSNYFCYSFTSLFYSVLLHLESFSVYRLKLILKHITPNSKPVLLPLHAPLTTTSLFSASTFLPCREVHLCHISDSTYKWYMVFSIDLDGWKLLPVQLKKRNLRMESRDWCHMSSYRHPREEKPTFTSFGKSHSYPGDLS